MLTFTPQSNLRNAREYFENHLVVGDYYSQGQVVPGEWMGVGAERLGLAGIVGKDEFVALCENLHPVTGEQLTPLHKTTRKELGADGSWPILPYAQMQAAWFYPESPTERLELRFPPYRVRIAGGNLSKLVIAFQKQAVESVRITAKSERLSQGDGPTWIASIEVEETGHNEGAD